MATQGFHTLPALENSQDPKQQPCTQHGRHCCQCRARKCRAPLPPNTPAWGTGWTQGQEGWCKTGTELCWGWCLQDHDWPPRLGLRDGASGWEPQAAAVQEGDRGRVQGPSASPAPGPRCWAGRREGQEGSSKGTLVSDEGSPLAVGLIILTVRLRGTLLLPDVRGEPLVGDDPTVQGIHLHTPQAEA